MMPNSSNRLTNSAKKMNRAQLRKDQVLLVSHGYLGKYQYTSESLERGRNVDNVVTENVILVH